MVPGVQWGQGRAKGRRTRLRGLPCRPLYWQNRRGSVLNSVAPCMISHPPFPEGVLQGVMAQRWSNDGKLHERLNELGWTTGSAARVKPEASHKMQIHTLAHVRAQRDRPEGCQLSYIQIHQIFWAHVLHFPGVLTNPRGI